MTQSASHTGNESHQMLLDGIDAPSDYWGDGWSDDEAGQQLPSTAQTHQEHGNKCDAKWSDSLGNIPYGFTQQEENELMALKELTRLLHQTLPSASTSMVTLNPLPKAIQYRYEWDEPIHQAH